MDQTAGGAQAPAPGTAGAGARPAADRPAGELVREMSELVPRLVRDEIKLARLEMTSKGKQLGIRAGAFAGGGLVALYAVGSACRPT
jgi:hypothetical protein